MNTIPTAEIRKRLEQEYATLAGRLRQIGSAAVLDDIAMSLAEGDRGLDLFDQVQASETRESHFASKDRVVSRLQRVAAALERLRDGSFGECLECGGPIALARLRAIPEVTTCVTCQERLERSGAAAARLARPAGVRAIMDDVDSGAPGAPAASLEDDEIASRSGPVAPRTSLEVLEALREHVVPEVAGPGRDAGPAPVKPAGRRPPRSAGHSRSAPSRVEAAGRPVASPVHRRRGPREATAPRATRRPGPLETAAR